MTNKPAHSPLPWRIESFQRYCEHTINGTRVVSSLTEVSDYDKWVMDNETYYALQVKPEDQEFIVRAVNSHYQMLDALKHTIRWIEKYAECSPPLKPGEWAWFTEAKKAIELAEKGTHEP